LFDGTYFHKQGCLILIIDIVRKLIITSAYIEKESYHNVVHIFETLRNQGLNPAVFTLDGHKKVTQAILEIWPQVTIQRCLFHIKNQGLMWIRYRPKTEAAWRLRKMLYHITNIQSINDRDCFIRSFHKWHKRYREFIASLPRDSVANKDLKRTTSLIQNALPNMFHYLDDNNIAPTTNYLEGFYSQLKHQYRSHRGLIEKHKIQYLKWYCYFRNRAF
jgi:transposase-like protein